MAAGSKSLQPDNTREVDARLKLHLRTRVWRRKAQIEQRRQAKRETTG